MMLINRFLVFSCLATIIILCEGGQALGGENEVIIFKQKLIPQLIQFAEAKKVKILEGETKEDFMAAAYSIARLRGKISFGVWDNKLVDELEFASGFLCGLVWWPKPEEDDARAKLQSIRRQITLNAYNRTIAMLSIENTFFRYSLDDVRNFIRGKKAPPDIRTIINVPLVSGSFIGR